MKILTNKQQEQLLTPVDGLAKWMDEKKED